MSAQAGDPGLTMEQMKALNQTRPMLAKVNLATSKLSYIDLPIAPRVEKILEADYFFDAHSSAGVLYAITTNYDTLYAFDTTGKLLDKQHLAGTCRTALPEFDFAKFSSNAYVEERMQVYDQYTDIRVEQKTGDVYILLKRGAAYLQANGRKADISRHNYTLLCYRPKTKKLDQYSISSKYHLSGSSSFFGNEGIYLRSFHQNPNAFQAASFYLFTL